MTDSSRFVLLVEDDLDINEAISSILKDQNYDVKSTFNGKEALDYLLKSPDSPSLIILDAMMPIMGGYEFRENQLTYKNLADIPTIMLTAGTKFENTKNISFTESIKKPLEFQTLIDIVQKYIPAEIKK